MLMKLLVMSLLLVAGRICAQEKQKKLPVKTKETDSTNVSLQGIDEADMIPVLLMNEDDKKETGAQYIAPLLTANRDPFYSAAAFQFSALRFSIRGYEGAYFQTLLNGIPMNGLEDGNTPWALWGGLNDVMRNTVLSYGLRSNDFSFGAIGTTALIDARASKQRKQTQFSYSLSNRSYVQRWMFTYNTGMQKNGWACTFSGSRRWADEGYTPGSFYDGWSYFMAIDKRLREDQVLSFSFFGSSLKNGRQGPVLMEMIDLTASNYNPYWGYQAGKKRTANTGNNHQPVWMLSHEWRLNTKNSLLTTVAYTTGHKNSTGLDWYKAEDPRPDYYRYLPSFQTDSLLKANVTAAIREQPQLQQINWQKLYTINKESVETINDVNGVVGRQMRGLRSRYILEERVNKIQRLNFNSTLNLALTGRAMLTAGLNLQRQRNRYYKKVADLLGGEFYVNWNQFAERDFPNNPGAIQYDLDMPNRVLRKGDSFGYDYSLYTNHWQAWIQASVTTDRIDFFAAASMSNTKYQREGHVRNGLFPGISYGRSDAVSFNNHAFKTGLTYKLNGRNYLYAHAALLTRAPFADNLFISPRTRDTRQDIHSNEQITATEIGYAWNTPLVKLRFSTYATQFRNGMNVLSFYHDEYKSFVNYAISNINRLHYGIEYGMELKLDAVWSMATAVSLGRYYFNSRQQVAVSLDNDDYVVAKEELYTNNFRIAGPPQEVYHLELRYQSPRFFFVNIAANYFRQQWLDFNPVRRTYNALQDVAAYSELWYRIIQQKQLPASAIVNLFAGKSWRLKTTRKGVYKNLLLNISVGNLLNNTGTISGGYEQLRFDMADKNTDKFPPKYFFAYGANYAINLTLRL